MSKYGQYCPVAQALEIVGDRWTFLIIRDLLTGTTRFNELERGLPGIPRALLAKRLRHLESANVIEKRIAGAGRQTTSYHLTQAGMELQPVINALLKWGAAWAFDEPSEEQLDPLLLMWWMRNRVCTDRLPEHRVVVQFDFQGHKPVTYWLMLVQEEVNICLTDPGYGIDVLVTAELAAFFKLWLGRIEYREAIQEHGISVDGMPRLIREFPSWFAWSHAAPAIRQARRERRG